MLQINLQMLSIQPFQNPLSEIRASFWLNFPFYLFLAGKKSAKERFLDQFRLKPFFALFLF